MVSYCSGRHSVHLHIVVQGGGMVWCSVVQCGAVWCSMMQLVSYCSGGRSVHLFGGGPVCILIRITTYHKKRDKVGNAVQRAFEEKAESEEGSITYKTINVSVFVSIEQYL